MYIYFFSRLFLAMVGSCTACRPGRKQFITASAPPRPAMFHLCHDFHWMDQLVSSVVILSNHCCSTFVVCCGHHGGGKRGSSDSTVCEMIIRWHAAFQRHEHLQRGHSCHFENDLLSGLENAVLCRVTAAVELNQNGWFDACIMSTKDAKLTDPVHPSLTRLGAEAVRFHKGCSRS